VRAAHRDITPVIIGSFAVIGAPAVIDVPRPVLAHNIRS